MTCCEASCQCIKFTFKAVFSSIGLCAMVVGYVILGGYVFEHIEGKHETFEVDKRNKARNDINLYRFKITDDLNKKIQLAIQAASERKSENGTGDRLVSTYTPTTTTDEAPNSYETVVSALIAEIENKINNDLKLHKKNLLGKKSKVKDSNDTAEIKKWSLPNSILFSTTVITTIGYGNLVPVTDEGKIVTILYAIVGVPLMLITLASMGSFMATCFRFCYQRCCSPLCSCLSSCLIRLLEPASRTRRRRKQQNNDTQTSPDEPRTAADSDNERDTDSLEIPLRPTRRRKPKDIPIYLSVVVLTTYLVSVAALFKFWENWDWLTSIYFCFITFSTVGFGDFVPGHSIDEKDNSYKAPLCAVAVLFGLVVMSMCFNLMQDTIFSYFQSCCRKIRSIGGNEEDGDEREESYMSVMEGQPAMPDTVTQNEKKKETRKKLEQSPV